MESEEINFMQVVKNLYKRRLLLWKILGIVSIIALLYTSWNDVLIRKTSAIVLIDKADASISETIDNLNTSKVTATFDKTKKTITFNAKGIVRSNLENEITEHMDIVKAKLHQIYKIGTYKITKEIKTEDISFVDIIKDIVVFETIGIILYCGYVFFISAVSSTKDDLTVYNLTKLKVLGKISKAEDSQEKIKSRGIFKKLDKYFKEEKMPLEEELEILKTNIDLNKEIKSPKTIMFVSAKQNVKASYVMNILSESYKKDGKKVSIVSANEFTKKNVNSEISELQDQFDIILIDGEIINKSSKSLVLANVVDTNIIVALAEKTKMNDIIKTKQYIEDIDGKISGIILNKA